MALTPLAFPKFNRTKEKLPPGLRAEIDLQVDAICSDPQLGIAKAGDLQGVRVCKFTFLGRLYLLGYRVDENSRTLYLLAIGGHENFYRDLKQYLKG